MASSSSTSTTKLQSKHDVFLSFRGEDTRVGFTSHLHDALGRKKILTFIDNDLKRGEEISPSLVKAIEDSMLSVIIFSKQYASSRWCLKELVKILECRKSRGQIVIPIFYKVDPSDVRNQSGSVGDAFAKLVERKVLEMEEERCFKDALKEAANISGHDSRDMGNESTFINKIVEDIFNRLYQMFPNPPMNLVGIDERISKIESLLEMESQKVRILGIWGMGGIGKTTIAKAVYDKIHTKFEASHFVRHIRKKLKGRRCRLVDLQTGIVLKLLDSKISDTGSLSLENPFIKRTLRRTKVLIVFDDVDDPIHLEESLLGQCDSFGPGSRILITSRNQHVLRQVNATYEVATYDVEALNNIEALQLLKSKAFKKFHPTSDHHDLLERVVNYAKGNPLALAVLGSALSDRRIEDWHSKLNGLGQGQDVDILKVLRISYDGLTEEEKNAFLDIACCFRGMDRYRVTPILQKKSSPMHFCISVLIDKSLVTETFDILQMHDLLREMAYRIVNEESKNPGKRRWLVDPEETYNVLKKRKGTEVVKGICLDLDMPESSKMRLKSDVFEGMRGLEFLIIKGNTSKVKLPRRGLKYLPKKLRYLRWDGYPSRSLAQKFCAKNLVEFDFQNSKVEELWSGRQELVNLRRIDFRRSRRLTKFPDLSEAKQLEDVCLKGCTSLIEVPGLSEAKQLARVDLRKCASLIEVPLYFQNFEHLGQLFLDDCYNLQSLPSKIDSNEITYLSLSGCSNIKKIPEISLRSSPYTKSLVLSGTAIEELPQLSGFINYLTLVDCSNFTKFPTISGDIETLFLDGSAIEEVPSSIQFLRSLKSLSLRNCRKLSSLSDSICKLKGLKNLFISGCSKLESFPEINEPMPSSIQFLPNLEVLDLTNCKELSSLPSSIRFLPNLKVLHLINCKKLSSLPIKICELKSLNALRLGGTAIRELPELPPSLVDLAADDCESLEIISSSTVGSSIRQLGFANCFKLDHKALMEELQLKIQFGKIAGLFRMVLPGSEIPQWFSDRNEGSSITLHFPSNTPNLKTIAFCSVFLYPYDIYRSPLWWKATIAGGEHRYICYTGRMSTLNPAICESYHMCLSYGIPKCFLKKILGREVRFEFGERLYDDWGRRRESHPVEVKMCGVHLIYENPDGLRPSISSQSIPYTPLDEDLRDGKKVSSTLIHFI